MQGLRSSPDTPWTARSDTPASPPHAHDLCDARHAGPMLRASPRAGATTGTSATSAMAGVGSSFWWRPLPVARGREFFQAGHVGQQEPEAELSHHHMRRGRPLLHPRRNAAGVSTAPSQLARPLPPAARARVVPTGRVLRMPKVSRTQQGGATTPPVGFKRSVWPPRQRRPGHWFTRGGVEVEVPKRSPRTPIGPRVSPQAPRRRRAAPRQARSGNDANDAPTAAAAAAAAAMLCSRCRTSGHQQCQCASHGLANAPPRVPHPPANTTTPTPHATSPRARRLQWRSRRGTKQDQQHQQGQRGLEASSSQSPPQDPTPTSAARVPEPSAAAAAIDTAHNPMVPLDDIRSAVAAFCARQVKPHCAVSRGRHSGWRPILPAIPRQPTLRAFHVPAEPLSTSDATPGGADDKSQDPTGGVAPSPVLELGQPQKQDAARSADVSTPAAAAAAANINAVTANHGHRTLPVFRSNTPWTQRVAKQHAHLSHHDAGWWRVMYARHGFNRREIMRLLSRFKALVCLGDDPRGIVRSVFCSAMPILAAEDARFTDRVFRVLDTNNSGIIEWPEFVYAVSCLEKGTLEQRADFLFQVFDEDSSGDICMGEVDRYFFVDGSAGVDAANSNRRGIGYRITEFVVRKMFASLGLSNPRDSVTRDEFVQRIVESGQTPEQYGLFGKTVGPQIPVHHATGGGSSLNAMRNIPHRVFWTRRLARRRLEGKQSELLAEIDSIATRALSAELRHMLEQQAAKDTQIVAPRFGAGESVVESWKRAGDVASTDK